MKDGAEIKWISGDGEGEDEIHTILFRKLMEEITYSGKVLTGRFIPLIWLCTLVAVSNFIKTNTHVCMQSRLPHS